MNDDALQRQLELEKKVAMISRRFVGLDPAELRGGIQDGMELAGEVGDCDRCDLALMNASRDAFENVYSWRRPEIEPAAWITGHESIEDFRWSGTQLVRGQPVHVRDVSDLPPEARGERAGAKRLGVVAFLSIPVLSESGFEGYITFSRLSQPKAWTEEEITLLTLVTELFANAARRREAEHELARQFEFELQIVDLSQRLLSLPPDRVDEEIRDALARAATMVPAECGYLVSLRGEAGQYDVYEWHGEDVPERSRGLDTRFLVDGETVVREVVQIRSVEHMPASASAIRESYTARGILATLWIPVLSAGEPIGVLCFDRTRGQGTWTEQVINLLKLTGQLLASALRRKREVEELEEHRRQLLQAQKLEAVGRLAGGIAHDFNNLLTVITGNASMLLDSVAPGDPFAEELDQIALAANRARLLTRQLLSFSRQSVLQPQVVDLGETVRGLSDMLARLVGEETPLDLEISKEPVLVDGDPNQIEQVIVNLSVNARDAMPQGGTLRIRTALERFDRDSAKLIGLPDAGDFAVLEVADTGVGMSAETLEHAIEPFYTTKEPHKGTGLGLYMVHGIAQRSGGALRIRSEPMQGTTVQFILPRSEPDAIEERPGETRERPTGGIETILVVEDEPAVRRLLRRTLERAGYRVLVAPNGVEALEVSAEFEGEIRLLISDIVMPRMRGSRLARELLTERPGIKVLFITGYAENESGAPELAGYSLQKPFSHEELLGKVRELLDAEDGLLGKR